jgi:hypothetical protein
VARWTASDGHISDDHISDDHISDGLGVARWTAKINAASAGGGGDAAQDLLGMLVMTRSVITVSVMTMSVMVVKVTTFHRWPCQ